MPNPPENPKKKAPPDPDIVLAEGLIPVPNSLGPIPAHLFPESFLPVVPGVIRLLEDLAWNTLWMFSFYTFITVSCIAIGSPYLAAINAVGAWFSGRDLWVRWKSWRFHKRALKQIAEKG